MSDKKWRANALAKCRADVESRTPWTVDAGDMWAVLDARGIVSYNGVSLLFENRELALESAAQLEFGAEFVDPAMMGGYTVQCVRVSAA